MDKNLINLGEILNKLVKLNSLIESNENSKYQVIHNILEDHYSRVITVRFLEIKLLRF